MDVEKIISLCKRRGILFPNSEIYGTFAGFFDYGNYGSELKRNVENSWWKHFVNDRDDMVGIDGAIITHPEVWKASGHLESFNDPLVGCTKCKKKYRADHLVEMELKISVDGLSVDHLKELIEKGFILKHRLKSGKTYSITEKGVNYIKQYSMILDFTESFGLE